jgi:hypothetical protein
LPLSADQWYRHIDEIDKVVVVSIPLNKLPQSIRYRPQVSRPTFRSGASFVMLNRLGAIQSGDLNLSCNVHESIVGGCKWVIWIGYEYLAIYSM